MQKYLKIPVDLKNQELITFLNSILVLNGVVDTVINDIKCLDTDILMSFSKISGADPTENEKSIAGDTLRNSGITYSL
ncbi:hypothetical protein HQQ94_18875 [Shewanella sp. VB17]|uniref:hypothetical protein n=1 Tax=Shewanella sp. VB17 TaxID=2739432 RepID=UPI00156638F1|nr:hypothetical protein [Shewanella sp. VB17]NRD75247.1 hypothetical protein [Shewanella sp. VB17]